MPVIRKEIGNHQFVVERANKNAFPKVGKANTLYVDKESGVIYRFDILDDDFVDLSDYLSSSHPVSNVTTEEIGHWNTAYTKISKSKSYVIPIPLIEWDNVDLEYVVEIPDLETSDTVILDGNNEIFAEYGLDAVIETDTLKFSVGVKPSSAITVKCSIIKTESGGMV